LQVLRRDLDLEILFPARVLADCVGGIVNGLTAPVLEDAQIDVGSGLDRILEGLVREVDLVGQFTAFPPS
jgi:hypothetical protein